MPNECELLDTCGFFKKYQRKKELACKGFLMQYCKGTKMSECKRKEYRQRYGKPPVDDMMPNGMMITSV
jgi:hypothetical protein